MKCKDELAQQTGQIRNNDVQSLVDNKESDNEERIEAILAEFNEAPSALNFIASPADDYKVRVELD